jgi:hypothetical protein
MLKKQLVAAGAAAFALSLTASAHAQIISQPGETMGVALGAPLPEGVYFVDLESYGKRDDGDGHLGVNIPLVAWATPFTFYDTRLEVLYAAPFTHIDSSTANRVDFYSQALLFAFAHDFGNGFNAALVAGPRTPDDFTNYGRGVAADIRASFSYVKNGYNATLTVAYSGDFGGKSTPLSANGGFNDNGYIDYTFSKKFGKLELGVVGFASTDFNQGHEFNSLGGSFIQRGVSVGGLVGYDFGKFTLQGMVTREVYGGPNSPVQAVNYGLAGGLETRGWLRLIVPLYVAPAPAAAAQMVRARY